MLGEIEGKEIIEAELKKDEVVLMEYLSLYRKWRPQNFAEIRGQGPIVKTLQNALEQNRVAHAYLFAGPRGTGKTSTAKILAKSLNCTEGVTPFPCGECESCKKTKNGYAIDVIEIDAASNRGIDEIRDLREKVKFLPSESRYKVYIIDEVHMLTTEAFNALLKTLEEPPSHVVFILATTELHKIPATILSRCQCFEFKPISLQDIRDSLSDVAKEEDLAISASALNLIAGNAQGGLRDALSLLDQVISFRGKNIEAGDVEAILGLANQQSLFRLGEILLEKAPEKIVGLVQQLTDEGRDLQQFVKGAVGHFRNLLLFKVCAEPQILLGLSTEETEQLRSQALKYRKNNLIKIIDTLSACEKEMKWAFQARWNLEVALIKLTETPEEDQFLELVERVKKLEEILTGVGSAQASKEEEPVLENTSKVLRKPKVLDTSSQKAVSKPAEEPVTISLADSEPSATLEEIQDIWPVVLEKLKKQKRTFHAYLLEGKLQEIQGDKIVLTFSRKFVFHKENAEKPEVKELVEKILKQVTQKELKVKCVLEDKQELATNPLELQLTDEEPPINQEEVLNDPLVKGALELFGGKIIEIKKEGNGEEK